MVLDVVTTIASHDTITSRRITLKNFPLFSEIDVSPEIIVRYLEACKADGTIPKPTFKICTSQLQKGNPSFVSVVKSIAIPTSETIPPQPIKNPSPQTFEDFDIEFDPSVTLGNFMNEPHSPNPNPE